MTEQQAAYDSGPKHVQAVRLENFRDPDWQGLLSQRLLPRYPAARIVSRQPYVVLVELRTSGDWSTLDDSFFVLMRDEGFFQRWETLSEIPPARRANRAVYEDIGYRVGSGERLTPTQQQALFSQLLDLEHRGRAAEQDASEQRWRAERAVERANSTATEHNAIVGVLDQELRVRIYSNGDDWIAEDAATGQVLLRDVALPLLYQKVLRLRLGSAGGHAG